MKDSITGRLTTLKSNFLRVAVLFLYSVLTSSGGGSTSPWQQENVSFPMMNLEIKATMEENGRQGEMSINQAANTTAETVNRVQWNDFKTKVTKIQDRLQIVSVAIQAVPTGIAVSREISKITQNQAAIIHEIETAPYALIAVLPSQIRFVDDLQMVTRLIAGLVVSYGAINQLEKSERKLLLDYALGEVKILSRNSTHMLIKIRDIKSKVLRNKRAYQYYVNRDRQVVVNIMKNIKSF